MLILVSVFFKSFLQHYFCQQELCLAFGTELITDLEIITSELCKETYIWPCCCFSVHTCCVGRQDLNLQKDQTKARLIFKHYLIYQKERQQKTGWALIMPNYGV